MENNPETKSPPFTEGRRKEIARSIVNGERFPMKERLNNDNFRIYFLFIQEIDKKLSEKMQTDGNLWNYKK